MKIDAIVRRLSDRQKVTFDPFAQMIEDGRLPEDVRPRHAPVQPEAPRYFLLTGATGFLGAYLLEALLNETTARVCCLVRRDSGGRSRLLKNIQTYGVWDASFEERVDVVEGDLECTNAGLSASTYELLSDSVDAVLHCGAAVNWIYPYRRLAGVNVRGTLELLRFACAGRQKQFHFISSSAVCYSAHGPRQIHEGDELMPHIRGIHLGYAQAKCVAESLVRQAGERGLATAVYRPALISGDSRTGRSNNGDFLSRFIKGCIAMKAAPDLDWLLDCYPVDAVARNIVKLSQHSSANPTFHLTNADGRYWRELILWINLFGYPVRLLPYRRWLSQLKSELQAPDHPLRELAPFFFYEVPGEPNAHLPQLYEEDRRSELKATATLQALETVGGSCPGLNASLLDRYFESFVDTGFLPPRRLQPVHRTDTDCGDLSSILGCRVIRAEAVRGTVTNSIVTELTSWRFKNRAGLTRYRLQLGSGRQLDAMVKVKPRDHEVIEVGNTIARLCSEELGDAYYEFRHGLEFVRSHLREPAIYAQREPRLRNYTPELYGAAGDTLVLEFLSRVVLKDSADDVSGWKRVHIEAVVEGIADIHSVWFQHIDDLFRDVSLGPVIWSSDVAEMMPFWIALANHATSWFSSWAGNDIAAIQTAAIAGLFDRASVLDAIPLTLIHNDFNPRNLALRSIDGEFRLCAYDWEMARVGLPQHDLAEFLCFVLDSNVHESVVRELIELHRERLEQASGIAIDRESFLLGFHLSLLDLLMNRFAMYTMVHRFRQQRFLPRVMRTWRHLYDMFTNCRHRL